MPNPGCPHFPSHPIPVGSIHELTLQVGNAAFHFLGNLIPKVIGCAGDYKSPASTYGCKSGYQWENNQCAQTDTQPTQSETTITRTSTSPSAISPNQETTYTFNIENNLDEQKTYDINVEFLNNAGEANTWGTVVSISPNSVELTQGETKPVSITITANTGITPGDYQFKVTTTERS